MTEQEKLNLVTNYFAEDWAIDKAMQLLEDYEKMTGNSSAPEADSQPSLTQEAASAMLNEMDMHDRVLAAIDAEMKADNVAAPAAERQYINGVKTVADLVNNLLLLDQSLPIYAAQHIQIANRRRTITVPPTVSRERVKDERWIGEGDELNAAVIWTRAEAPAAGAVAGSVLAYRAVAPTGHVLLLEWGADQLAEQGWTVTDLVAAAPTPAAQADSVLEDAARWQYLRDVREVALCVMFFGNGCTNITMADVIKAIDAKIAARKQGSSHD